VITLCLTFFAGPIFDLASRAADGLTHPSIYVSIVFPDEGDAP
jgi:multicomponent Na+:H+ antiporter subunit D